MSLMFPTVMVVMSLSSVAVLWFGGQRIDAQEMQVGALSAFLTYIMQSVMAIMMSVMMFVLSPRAAVSAERIEEVLNTDSTVIPPTDPVRDMPDRGRMEMRGVQFHYPGAEEPVLHDISFTAVRGKTTAIIDRKS